MADHDSAAPNQPCPPSINDTAIVLWWVVGNFLVLAFVLSLFAMVCSDSRLEQYCRDAAGTEPCVVAAQCAESKMPVGREGQHVVHGAQDARAQGRGA